MECDSGLRSGQTTNKSLKRTEWIEWTGRTEPTFLSHFTSICGLYASCQVYFSLHFFATFISSSRFITSWHNSNVISDMVGNDDKHRCWKRSLASYALYDFMKHAEKQKIISYVTAQSALRRMKHNFIVFFDFANAPLVGLWHFGLKPM